MSVEETDLITYQEEVSPWEGAVGASIITC